MTIKRSQPDLASRMRAAVATPVSAAKPNALKRGFGTAEQRRTQRADKYKRACLILETGERIDVAVRNISEIGARVDFHGGGIGSSSRVTLLEPSLGLKKRARVIWRDQRSVGLSFEE